MNGTLEACAPCVDHIRSLNREFALSCMSYIERLNFEFGDDPYMNQMLFAGYALAIMMVIMTIMKMVDLFFEWVFKH